MIYINNMNKKVLDIPYYSLSLLKGFEGSGCGIVSLAMVLDFISKKRTNIEKLKDEGLLVGARVSKYGWTQEGICSLARNKGLNAYFQEFRSVKVDLKNKSFKERGVLVNSGIDKIRDLIKKNTPVIVSVSKGFNGNEETHLVVVTGFNEKGFYFNDSRIKTGGKSIFTSFSKFKKYWRKRILVVYK